MRRHLAIAAGIGLFVAAAAGCRAAPGPETTERRLIELDSSSLTRARVEMGAGTLEMIGGSSRLVDAEFTYNVPAWKPELTHTSRGGEGDLQIAQRANTGTFSNAENRWRLAFNDAHPLELSVNFGAGEARMTLGSLNLRRVAVNMGAGELDMDLRGTPKASYSVDVQGGVGSATIRVPSNIGIVATASGGVGSIDVSGLEERGGRWINPRAEGSPVTITLNVQGGVGEIEIVAE